jgi:4a-hydroxytetrahydrobiopterin dehydratase
VNILKPEEIKEKLKSLDGWIYGDNMIHREFKMEDFKEALSFTVKAGEEAEKMNHHPDILIHSYNKVRFSVMTHDMGGITEKDFELAARINNLVD